LSAFFELQTEVHRFLLEGGDPLLELVGAVRGTEARIMPYTLAKRLGEPVFELLGPRGEASSALLGIHQVGLERSPADGWQAWCTVRFCLQGMGLPQDVPVAVEEAAVDASPPGELGEAHPLVFLAGVVQGP
jgi:hypothetical protein